MGCWAEGEPCAHPGLCASELEADGPYALLCLGWPASLGGPAGFLRRPEIPENALGCIQPNHNHLSAGPHGSPSSCPHWHAFPGCL